MRVKEKDGILVSSKRELKGVWTGHFESLMNEETAGKAIVSSMSKEGGGRRGSECLWTESLKER